MKKRISVLAAILLAIGLTACGNNETRATNDASQNIEAESSKEADQVVASEAASNIA